MRALSDGSPFLITAFQTPIAALARLRQSGDAPKPAWSSISLASFRIGLTANDG